MNRSQNWKTKHPFFSQVAQLKVLSSTSDSDTSASSATTDLYFVLSDGPRDKESESEPNVITAESVQDESDRQSDITICDRCKHDEQNNLRENSSFDNFTPVISTQPKPCRKQEFCVKQAFAKQRHEEIFNKNHKREYLQSHENFNQYSSVPIGSVVPNFDKHEVPEREFVVCKQQPKLWSDSPIYSEYDLVQKCKPISIHTNKSLKNVYESYLQRNPNNFLVRLDRSESSRNPKKKNKYTLGKNRIKCIRNHVKKDILGDQYKFLETPIDSDVSTVKSIDLKRHLNENPTKKKQCCEIFNPRKSKTDDNTIPGTSRKKTPARDSHHQGRNIRTQGSSLCVKENVGFYDITFKAKNKSYKVPLNVTSESSISTLIMKRNLDQIDRMAALVIPSCLKQENLSWKYSKENLVHCQSKNVPRINDQCSESKVEFQNNVNDNLKRKQVIDNIKLNFRKAEDTCARSTHLAQENSNSKNERQNRSKRGEKISRDEIEHNINEIISEKSIRLKTRPRVVLNTLYLKDRYLILAPPAIEPKESDIILESARVSRKPKSCPPSQSCTADEEKSGTARNCSPALDQIKELIVSQKSEEHAMENNGKREREHCEDRQTSLNGKLAKSIMLLEDNSKLAQASEDLFKSHCDVYYVNTARNFKRKKYQTNIDKKERFFKRDDVFSKTNCDTIYTNKTRNFRRNISK